MTAAIVWWGSSRRREMAPTKDTRVTPPPRLTLDAFFALHRLAVIDRLRVYAVNAKRQQIVDERRTRFWHLWAEVEGSSPHRKRATR